jgi:hypothetical protein
LTGAVRPAASCWLTCHSVRGRSRGAGTPFAMVHAMTPINRLVYAFTGLTVVMLIAAVTVAMVSMLPALLAINGR